MRPFEAIVAWNQRVTGGAAPTSWPADEFPDAFPIIALTCIDVRLNAHFPNVLGVRPEQFIWLRNAGNVITGTESSTMRSLALACAIKGGREIAIIGHSDCGVRKASATEIIDRFRALGVPREKLPADLVAFFGTFASERQNVIRGVEFTRQSPFIGPRVPVHGLLIDTHTGRLEWVVNGYATLDQPAVTMPAAEETTPPPTPPEPPPLEPEPPRRERGQPFHPQPNALPGLARSRKPRRP